MWVLLKPTHGGFMFRSTARVALAAALCSSSAFALAENLRVPQQHPTIQGAVNAAADGDTVLVAPGTYVENLLISRPLTLRSTAGAESTTIDGGAVGPVVVVRGTGAESVTISGFTLTNGFNTFSLPGGDAPAMAAGIHADSVTITIRDNIIRNNDGCLGSGISTIAAAATIQHNQIVDNTQRPECDGGDGGGIFLRVDGAAASLVANNVIARHRIGGRGAGIAVQAMNSLTIRDNLISANEANSPGGGTGGGILINIGSATITGNTLVGNSALEGGAMALYPIDPSNRVVVQGNLMDANKSVLQGSSVYAVTFWEDVLSLTGNVINGGSDTALIYCSGGSYPVRRSNLLHNTPGPLVGGGCVPQ
jgi:nitrous oxidase accessory protein NosD